MRGLDAQDRCRYLREIAVLKGRDHAEVRVGSRAFHDVGEIEDVGFRLQRRIVEVRGGFRRRPAAGLNGSDQRIAMRRVVSKEPLGDRQRSRR